MSKHTKLGLLILLILVGILTAGHFFGSSSRVFNFDFQKTRNDAELENIISAKLRGIEGDFAVYIEELPASPSAEIKNPKRYALNENQLFPSASLYKLVLIAAVFKEIENGTIKIDEVITSTKTHLIAVLGEEDFGYSERPEKIAFTVSEALERVGRISDNFAAIMLTDRLRQVPQKDGEDGLLIKMAKEIGMDNTDFLADPIKTTASDTAMFFRSLYKGQIVSSEISSQIVKILSLNQLNNRIPAKLPKDVKVVHKTGELAGVRHDAGIVFPSPKSPNSVMSQNTPYLIILLSQNLKYEDDGVEVLAEISKEVWEYFKEKK